jgi:hypothetical protein
MSYDFKISAICNYCKKRNSVLTNLEFWDKVPIGAIDLIYDLINKEETFGSLLDRLKEGSVLRGKFTNREFLVVLDCNNKKVLLEIASSSLVTPFCYDEPWYTQLEIIKAL